MKHSNEKLETAILTRLQAGETAESIAQSLIDALNNANEKHENELAKQAANSQKVADLQSILDALQHFMIKYYCSCEEDIDSVKKSFEEFPAQEIINLIDQLDTCANHLNIIIGGAKDNKVNTQVNVNADQIIDDFLSSMGLK